MSSLRDALAQAQASLEKEITEDSLKNISEITREIVTDIREEYNNFFGVLSEEVLNTGAVANTEFTPAIFKKPGVSAAPWARVTNRWFETKQTNSDPQALEFYHGITYGIITRLSRKKNKRTGERRKRKPQTRTGLSFDQFVQALAADGQVSTEHFFGPLQVAYEFTRPDGVKGTAKSVDDVITKVLFKSEKGGTFRKFLDGTTIKVDITAFSAINDIATERAMIGYLIQKGGYKEQWFKITSGGHKYRPIILPLVSYYTKYFFNSILRNALS